jgi:hypothetical protein
MDIMDITKPAQLPVRKEVQDFVLAAEKLLSPVLRSSELTPEECHIICEYLMTMCRETHPWSSQFEAMQSVQPSLRKAQASACRDQHPIGWTGS